MERRDFLSGLAIGAGVGAIGGAGVVLPGCGAAPIRPELGARETNELLGRLDRGLASVRDWPAGSLIAQQPSWQLRPDVSERVLRTGLEALVVADVARSIPEDTALPAEFAQRLGAELPKLAEATSAYHALLTTAPPAVRRGVDRRFREEPDIGMDVCAVLDRRAAEIGISPESRLRLRTNTAQITSRIRRQSSNAVIDDTIAKVESVIARSGADVALVRGGTTRAMVEAIWQQVEGVYVPGGSPSGQTLGAPTGAYVPPDREIPPGTEPAPTEPPGDNNLRIGGIMVGAGLAAFGIGTLIGWAAGSAMWGAIIAATPGSILVIIGIVFLIIGGVRNASAE